MRVIVSCVLQKTISCTEIVQMQLVVEVPCGKESVRDTIIRAINDVFAEMRKNDGYVLISHSVVIVP